MAKTSQESYDRYLSTGTAATRPQSTDGTRLLDRTVSIKWTLILMSAILTIAFLTRIGLPMAAGGHGGGPEVVAVKVDGVVVNLNEEEDMHYLKSSFEIEPSDPKEVEKIQSKMALIRHEMMLYLSSLSVSDTQGEKNKNNIRSALMKRLENALETYHLKIRNLYFTEFVVQ